MNNCKRCSKEIDESKTFCGNNCRDRYQEGKCETCGTELAKGIKRFCGEPCRIEYDTKLYSPASGELDGLLIVPPEDED